MKTLYTYTIIVAWYTSTNITLNGKLDARKVYASVVARISYFFQGLRPESSGFPQINLFAHKSIFRERDTFESVPWFKDIFEFLHDPTPVSPSRTLKRRLQPERIARNGNLTNPRRPSVFAGPDDGPRRSTDVWHAVSEPRESCLTVALTFSETPGHGLGPHGALGARAGRPAANV